MLARAIPAHAEPSEPIENVMKKFSPPPVFRCALLGRRPEVEDSLAGTLARIRPGAEVVRLHDPTELSALARRAEMDVLFLDHDGDAEWAAGFADAFLHEPRLRATPVILLVSDAEVVATRALLMLGVADVVDWRMADDAMLETGLARAMASAGRAAIDREAVLSNALADAARVRSAAARNMRLLKGHMMPLLGQAWQSAAQSIQRGEHLKAQRLARTCRSLAELIDDTTIVAMLRDSNRVEEPVDLAALIAELVDDEDGEVQMGDVRLHVGAMPCLQADRPALALLFSELIVNAIRSARLGHVPDLSFSCGEDADGHPIVIFEDDGVQLSLRKQMLVGRAGGATDQEGADPMIWSLCQRLAERNDGVFRIHERRGRGVRIAIRFPKARLVED